MSWSVPPPTPRVEEGITHVWRVCFDQLAPEVRLLLPLEVLSPGEWARAGRFRQEADRDRFVVMRAVLRQVLGWYLHLTPGRVVFGFLPGGKPVLPATGQAADLHFNLAHSGRLGLVAVSARPVGVDVEFMDPAVEIGSVARRAFTPAEQAELWAASPLERRASFYRLWTIKEAALKAAGTGLPGLDRGHDLSAWQLQVLEPGGPYAAAVAHSGTRVRRWDWAAGREPGVNFTVNSWARGVDRPHFLPP